MPPNQTKWITHTFAGGWATDYGNTFYGSPEGDQIAIPWMNVLENVSLGLDGSIGQHPGTVELLDAPLINPLPPGGVNESTVVRSLYEYTRLGSSLSGTSELIAIVGQSVFSITNGVKTYLGTLDSAISPCHLSTFNDLLIIGDGFSTPVSYDQTTFGFLAGTPPTFSFSIPHAGRHWAAGVSSNPSRLYYSAVGNPEDWVGVGSGAIDIDPGDGDSIVGLLSHKRELWIFKGPTKLSIHRLSGTTTSDFTRTTFVTGISAVGQNAIFPTGDDFGFWSPRGSCHSLAATSNYGDFTESYINFPILSWCQNSNNLRFSLGNYTQSISNKSSAISYHLLNSLGFGSPFTSPTPFVLVMDTRFRSDQNPYPRFHKITFDKFASICLSYSQSASNQLSWLYGSYDGRVFRENVYPSNSVFHRSSANITSKVHPPYLTYGPPIYKKSILGCGIEFVPNESASSSGATATLSIGGPGIPTQNIEFNPVVGTRLGSFLLDTTTLGPYGNTSLYREYAVGESHLMQYELNLRTSSVSGNASESRIHHFGVGLTTSGSSMEY